MLLGMLEDESKVGKRCKGYVSKSKTKKNHVCERKQQMKLAVLCRTRKTLKDSFSFPDVVKDA